MTCQSLIFAHRALPEGANDLLAFDAHLVPEHAPGTILDTDDLVRSSWAATPVAVGGVTWSQNSGIIDAIFVEPLRRREGIGTALIAAAVGLHRATTSQLLRCSPFRTALGEVFAARTCAGQTDLAALLLPMTTQEQTKGARDDQLVPDNLEVLLSHPTCRNLDHNFVMRMCQASKELATSLRFFNPS